MNTPNVHAGRLERRVRRVGNETMPGVHEFCSFFPFGAIHRLTLLRLTALPIEKVAEEHAASKNEGGGREETCNQPH